MKKKKKKKKKKKGALVCDKTQDVLAVLVLVVWQPNNVLPKTSFNSKINNEIV